MKNYWKYTLYRYTPPLISLVLYMSFLLTDRYAYIGFLMIILIFVVGIWSKLYVSKRIGKFRASINNDYVSDDQDVATFVSQTTTALVMFVGGIIVWTVILLSTQTITMTDDLFLWSLAIAILPLSMFTSYINWRKYKKFYGNQDNKTFQKQTN